MSRWDELEDALIEGYASPEYVQWYKLNVGDRFPEDFNPVERGAAAAADLRKTFESGSRSDWMKNNPFSAAIVQIVFGFRTTKQWRDAWMGKAGPSAAKLKREKISKEEQEGFALAEKHFKMRRWLTPTKMTPLWRAYIYRMRELHGMDPRIPT